MHSEMHPEHRLVWSTDGAERGDGRVRSCPRCGASKETCRCAARTAPAAAAAANTPRDGVVRLSRSKAGRGGKVVTVIVGLPGDDAEIEGLARLLKKHCGVGGTVAGGVIELQGEQREKAAAKLATLGFRVKIAGG